MQGTIGQLLRDTWRPVMGAAALGLFLVGCGDKESNPDALTVAELKYPGNLVIKDQGNGAADLWWSGANNEEKFDGYNVYGMKGTPATLGLTEGKALELLNDKGEPVDASKTTLGNFNYSPDTKLTAKAATTNDDGEVEFSALPIHTGAADARLLPTCKPTAGVCGMTTAANKDATASDPTYAVNGPVKFTVPDAMEVGESYCFLILSSIDGGQSVSQTSSNAECFTPKYKAMFNVMAPNGGTKKNLVLDPTTWLGTCTAAGCGDPNATSPAYLTEANASHNSDDTGAIYVESGTVPAFVAGKNSGIIDLGFYADGFADNTLPSIAPTFVLDTNVFTTGGHTSPVFNGGGYSLAGQSVPLEKNHVYVFAVGDGAATTAVTEFYYHWLYVSGTVTPGENVAVEMRLSKVKTK